MRTLWVLASALLAAVVVALLAGRGSKSNPDAQVRDKVAPNTGSKLYRAEPGDPAALALEAALNRYSRQPEPQPKVSDEAISAQEMLEAVPLDELLARGYYEAGSGLSSDYQELNDDELISMAQGGDATAQLIISMQDYHPIRTRADWALKAARQGYTSAFTRIATTPRLRDTELAKLGNGMTVGSFRYAYLSAAAQLKDPYASEMFKQYQTYIGTIEPSEIRYGELYAKDIIYQTKLRNLL